MLGQLYFRETMLRCRIAQRRIWSGELIVMGPVTIDTVGTGGIVEPVARILNGEPRSTEAILFHE